jgi:hypothetical protein
MTEAFRVYRRLKEELIYMRWLHSGDECPEEEALVEALAEVWYQLSDAERAQIKGEGPQTLLQDGPMPRVMLQDTAIFTHPGAPPRRLHEAA